MRSEHVGLAVSVRRDQSGLDDKGLLSLLTGKTFGAYLKQKVPHSVVDLWNRKHY